MKGYTTRASSATGTRDPRVPAAKENRLHRPRVQCNCAEWVPLTSRSQWQYHLQFWVRDNNV